MNVAIIGGGFSGVAAAKILAEFGHRVTVFEQCPDIGGVWSGTRRYPGLETQNPASTYHFSDEPMPRSYPEWPDSDQVRAYLQGYVKKHGLDARIRLNTKVTALRRPETGKGWHLSFVTGAGRDAALPTQGGESTEDFDHVVVANGTFSAPSMPDFDQDRSFAEHGGQVVHTSQYPQLSKPLTGKHCVVVGYGRSACDCANRVADVADSTTVVTRSIAWKLPRYLGGALNYKFLLLTRFGECLFKYIRPGLVERFIFSPLGIGVRSFMMNTLGWIIKKQLSLEALEIVPKAGFEDIACSRIALSTEGFYRKLKEGKSLFLKQDAAIERLFADETTKQPMAKLSSGETIRADAVICGTGFRQTCPFLPSDVVDKLTDSEGNWTGLYRQVLPVGVSDLTFVGYNSSLFCPTTSEMAALWIAAYLQGDQLELPTEEDQRKEAQDFFEWLHKRSRGRCVGGHILDGVTA